MKFFDIKEINNIIANAPNKPIIFFLIIAVIASFFIASLGSGKIKTDKDKGIDSGPNFSTESIQKTGTQYRMDTSLIQQDPAKNN